MKKAEDWKSSAKRPDNSIGPLKSVVDALIKDLTADNVLSRTKTKVKKPSAPGPEKTF